MADFGWKNGLINVKPLASTPVSTNIALNPWGRSSNDSFVMSRNLHRTDLWYVDFSTVYSNLLNYFDQTGKVDSVYCKSITLPETRVKAEVFKRDGIPFNMPSWDDPLDAITVVLYMESVMPNPVVRFFTDWLALVRAGRGERYTNGFDSSADFFGKSKQITLDDGSGNSIPYGIDFSFPFKVWLLQGAMAPPSVSKLVRSASGVITNASPFVTTPSWCQLIKVTGFEVRGWLSGFKVGDLTYEGSQILTCEAKIYPEYIIQTS